MYKNVSKSVNMSDVKCVSAVKCDSCGGRMRQSVAALKPNVRKEDDLGQHIGGLESCRKDINDGDDHLVDVVRQPMLRIKLPCAVIVVASQWPCWLSPVLSLRLPLAGAFFPQSLHALFEPSVSWSKPKLMDSWSNYEDFLQLKLPCLPLIVLASGQGGKLLEALSRLKGHKGVFMVAMNTSFLKSRSKDTRRF